MFSAPEAPDPHDVAEAIAKLKASVLEALGLGHLATVTGALKKSV